MYYNEQQLIERVKQLPDFKTKLNSSIPSNYWIIGIRSENDEPNKFDDVFYLMKGETIIIETTGTTNPGTPVLKGGYLKYNKDGAAVIAADRIYPDCWKYRLHNKKIPALCQWWKGETQPIDYFRDGDGDNKSEEIGKLYSGWVGLNFHADEYDIEEDNRDDSKDIGWWSAGCQVNNQMEDYKRIIDLTKNQLVTYVPLNEFSI